MTDIPATSKPDTVLLLDQGLADAFVDHSQYRTDLIEQGDYLDESPSARTAIDAPREISLIWDIQVGESGVLLEHGNAENYSYRIRINAGAVECHEAGALRVSVALPGLAVGADRRLLISWCQHPDGTNVRSELYVANLTNGAVAHAQATHSAGSTSATDTLTIGASFGGASGFSDPFDWLSVRIGRRFHATVEQREDWVSQVTPPATTMTRRGTPLVPARASLDVAGDGVFAGPAHLLAGHVFEASDRRLVGPLVNLQVHDPLAIDHDFDVPNTAWWKATPDGSGMRMCIALLWYRPVPGKVNRARVRLYVRQTGKDGQAAEVRYRMYSIANLPIDGEPVIPMNYYRSAEASSSTAHGDTTGAGEWLSLGELPLARDDLGFTWLAIGVAFDEDSDVISDTSAHVHAVTVEPFFEPGDDVGLDFEDP